MKKKTNRWEDIDPAIAEKRVFEVQMRIHRAAKEAKREEMHKIQRHLVKSFHARCLAVRRAAETGKGRRTAGVDGRKSLSHVQMMELASRLRLSKRPDPVLRVTIPKPGSIETRPLGIPTIADRAHQHLIRMALEPEWEARFPGAMYGFRRGRSAHDALVMIRYNIQRKPKWVLDGDIEKFFDRLDHDAILKDLDTFSEMERAVGRILKAGMIEGEVFEKADLGTPQGGPLSPLLANIALCRLEDDLTEAFPRHRRVEGERVGREPRLILYADDFVVLHDSRAVIEEAKRFIAGWLAPKGLSLNAAKTRVCHTLEAADAPQGFTFLGCEIRQRRVGRHQKKPFFNGMHTHIGPSREARKRIYAKCAEIVDQAKCNKRRNAERTLKEAAGAPTPQELIIHRLRPVIRGWANYHRWHNSKEALGELDHKLFRKLHRWTRRTYPKLSQRELVDRFFNGGHPWTFKSLRKGSADALELPTAKSTPIRKHIPVRSDASFYDGDWAYWGKRRGQYPSLPPQIGKRLKGQNGRCPHCAGRFQSSERVTLQEVPDRDGSAKWRLVHESCADQRPCHPRQDAFVW